MATVTLTITANSAEELNNYLQGLAGAPEQQITLKEEVPTPTKNKEKAKHTAEPKPEKEDTKTEVEKEESAPSVTVEEIRAKAKEVAKGKGKPALKVLLGEYEAASITALETDKYDAFFEALEEALNE